ncbi:hypothetical protein IQ249_21105 [Lusitaniella coriacea LEGE 07157]|uniref:Uncharacterized protein n=1 Tax=Lusitaniella coriacea LEGE 07157 TaxID=945747 RepID=A0A8J7E4D3_9CYAN|nr:hypothetical protein [Lusitaniella coriacea]MBE9118394.1 hypothetical protein [Lusitaniella coriacea LEGE 07157]
MNPKPAVVIAAILLGALAPFPGHTAQKPTSFKQSDFVLAEELPPFEDGYRIGYQLGRDLVEIRFAARGREYYQSRAGYNPQVLGMGNSTPPENERDRQGIAGYQAGFLAGFHDGYAENTQASIAEIERFNDGYDQGYHSGLDEALACKKNPACAYRPTPNSRKQEDKFYDNGYNIGYWQGFERGWSLEKAN